MEKINFLEKIKEPIFYITNDVAKGIGLENLLPDYHIICLDDHPLVDYLEKAGVKVFCLERVLKQKNRIFRSTGKIIDHPLVLEYIKKESSGETPQILFFKPSSKIDLICKKFGFNRLGNPSPLNRIFEDKISFYDLCRQEGLPVPEGELTKLAQAENFEETAKKYGLPFVVQFGRGWAGSTTFFVNNESELAELKAKYPDIPVKITEFIKGITLLNNACIFAGKVLTSPPAMQIPSFPNWTSLAAATCGRQWPAEIGPAKTKEIDALTEKVGRLMAEKGYRGFFGLDFLLEDKTGRIFLSENNARLTASAPFFTKLEIEALNNRKAERLPLTAFHLLSFLDLKEAESLSYLKTEVCGSEIVFRNKEKSALLVKGSFAPGVYTFSQEKLTLKRKDYSFFPLADKEVWLTAAASGRLINPEVEIGRIILNRKILADRSINDPSVFVMVKQVKSLLMLEKC